MQKKMILSQDNLRKYTMLLHVQRNILYLQWMKVLRNIVNLVLLHYQTKEYLIGWMKYLKFMIIDGHVC